MEKTGRKNAAGDWLRGKLFSRAASIGILYMALAGFGLGFMVRGFAVFDAWPEILTALVMLGLMVVGLSALYLYCRHLGVTWGRGLAAERQVGDLIEHAVAQRGCAFAHDVKGGRAGQRRSRGDDTGGHLGGGDQGVLAEQAEVSCGVAPSRGECTPGSPPSRHWSSRSRRACHRGPLQGLAGTGVRLEREACQGLRSEEVLESAAWRARACARQRTALRDGDD